MCGINTTNSNVMSTFGTLSTDDSRVSVEIEANNSSSDSSDSNSNSNSSNSGTTTRRRFLLEYLSISSRQEGLENFPHMSSGILYSIGESWICWGCQRFYSKRKLLLLLAFTFNLMAIACLTVAAVAIHTTPNLATVGWAKATMQISDLEECRLPFTTESGNDNDATSLTSSASASLSPSPSPSLSSLSLTIHAYLGLTGYYGTCQGEFAPEENASMEQATTSSLESVYSTPHRDTFCSGATNLTDVKRSLIKNVSATSHQRVLYCELVSNLVNLDTYSLNDTSNDDTVVNVNREPDHFDDDDEEDDEFQYWDDDDFEDRPSCSACKETSRSCIGTLISSAGFGIFPLILTIRRFYFRVSTRKEQELRLRTVFFSGLALGLGVHAFFTFNGRCATTKRVGGMPSAFSIVIWSPICNNGQPFTKTVPRLHFRLFLGAILVMIGAIFKLCYFCLHLITPVANLSNNDNANNRNANNSDSINNTGNNRNRNARYTYSRIP